MRHRRRQAPRRIVRTEFSDPENFLQSHVVVSECHHFKHFLQFYSYNSKDFHKMPFTARKYQPKIPKKFGRLRRILKSQMPKISYNTTWWCQDSEIISYNSRGACPPEFFQHYKSSSQVTPTDTKSRLSGTPINSPISLMITQFLGSAFSLRFRAMWAGEFPNFEWLPLAQTFGKSNFSKFQRQFLKT